MSGFNNFCKKVKKTAAKVAKKTGEAADIAAKYVKLHKIDSKLDDRYEMLGRLTYKQLKTGESYAEKIALYIDSIDKLRVDRKALNDEIEADKARYKAAREAEEQEELEEKSEEKEENIEN
ncbi:MAG: hypothetical protein E7678_05935 [Ruminococcaceae bacterium]|nr:hypothetical protein [Oscillospiraceae bacterium]